MPSQAPFPTTADDRNPDSDIPPKKKADRPVGEWNTFTIKMVGDRMWVKLNGEPVIDGEKNRSLDGK